MSDEVDPGKRSIERSMSEPDRAFRVIGSDSGRHRRSPQRADDPDRCPVTPLGHCAGTFYFLDAAGQFRELTARALGMRQDLLALFGGDDTYLKRTWPKREKVGGGDESDEPVVPGRTIDFVINAAAKALQKACFDAGIWGDHIARRLPGIWRDEIGRPVVHCGDLVLIGDQWVEPGARIGTQIFVAAPATKRPDLPCAASVGQEIQQRLQDYWCWGEVGGPIALLGLICNAYYGAAIDWRPNCFVTGPTGSGKSMLLGCVRAAWPMHHYDNDTTKAGVEQAIPGRAMPIILDEAADRANQQTARNLIDLVLSAAGGEGTRGSRGTSDGKGRRIELVGLMMMFSINPPELEPQHLGRLTLIELSKPETDTDFQAEHFALREYISEHSGALWGRALAGIDRYRTALALFREGLRKVGCPPREMDQAGALLAGWWVLVHEGIPDACGVLEGINALDPERKSGFIRSGAEVAADDRERRMLDHLVSTVPPVRGGPTETVGKLIRIAFGSLRPDDSRAEMLRARELLEQFGIRVVRAAEVVDAIAAKGKVPPYIEVADGVVEDGIWFSGRSAELGKLFAGTPFAGDRWKHELLRVHSAARSKGGVRIGGPSGRAIWVLRRVVLGDEEEQE